MKDTKRCYCLGLCCAMLLMWSGSAMAQINPDEQKKAKAVRIQSKQAVPKKKTKRGAEPRPPQMVQGISPESAFENGGQEPAEPTADERVDALEAELADLKAMLARTGISLGTESLSPSQQQRIGELEQQLQQTRLEHKELLQAVENGLDVREAQPVLKRLERRMETLHQQLDILRAEPPLHEDEIVGEKLAESEARIEALEMELAQLKQVQDAEAEAEEKRNQKWSWAKVNKALPVDIFAFGDVMYHVQENGPDSFAIGQLELDITEDLTNQVTLAAAIAYDGETETLGLRSFTIDSRLLGADESHWRVSKKIDSLGFMLGKFDVPFGIDYLEYASIKRRLVTGPLAVEGTHDEWNDLGGQVYLVMPRFNTVVYAVNGFSYDTTVTGTNGVETVLEHPTALAVGGRVGVLPISQLEIGGSFAAFINPEAEVAQLLTGADLALHVADFEVKGEYIYMKQGMDIDESNSAQGFYAGALYDFKPVFVTARYSTLWPEVGDSEKQLSAGVGVAVFDHAEVRLEYSSDLESGGSAAFIQFAAGIARQPTGLRR